MPFFKSLLIVALFQITPNCWTVCVVQKSIISLATSLNKKLIHIIIIMIIFELILIFTLLFWGWWWKWCWWKWWWWWCLFISPLASLLRLLFPPNTANDWGKTMMIYLPLLIHLKLYGREILLWGKLLRDSGWSLSTMHVYEWKCPF